MKRGLFVLGLFFICSSASADMVEIKGEGFFNGTIDSEDNDQVTFTDATGKARTVARKDVLFMERQNEPSEEKKTVLKAAQVLKVPKVDIKQVVNIPKKPAASAKKKAPAKSGGGAGGGDATGALRAIARAERAVAANNAKVEAMANGVDEMPKKKDTAKSRFSSL